MKLIPALIALIHFGCVLGLPAVDSGGFNRIIAYTTSLFDEFVSDYVEPKYEVVRTIADGEIEERKYIGDLPWACTTKDESTTRRTMFWSLFQYIQGQNDANTTIPMTTPVRSLRNTGESENSIMCFFLGKTFQTVEPPRPNSAKVEIQRTPETTVFTRRVGGYMRGNAWENEFEELKAVLEANNIENFETSYYYVNGYDSPWKFFNRRNEVWIVKN